MDPIELLENDHRTLKRLLAEGQAAKDERAKQETFDRIRVEMTVHEIIEEEIFYPACKEHPKAKEIVLEGYEEHHVVDLLLGELMGISPSNETWDAKFDVMKENVEHHIGEEESDLFPKARQVFDRGELDDLGSRMEARKREATAERTGGAQSGR